MHGYDQLIGVNNDQSMRVLKSEAWRRVGLAGVPQPAIRRSPLPEVIRPECDRV